MEQRPPQAGLPALANAAREHTVQQLCAAYASDALDGVEFERRLDLAYRALTPAELTALTADLPARAEGAEVVPARAAVPGTLPAVSVPANHLVVAVMGGAERKGSWIPARRTYAVGFMGGVALDFREARFGPGVTEVYIVAFMGGVEVIVPPGLRVETNGIGFMGGFEHVSQMPPVDDPQAPRLLIHGIAVMGGVEVSSRLPGESEKQARKRLRDTSMSLRIEAGRGERK